MEELKFQTDKLFGYHEFPAGYIDWPKPGQYSLKINPVTSQNAYLMYLKSIKLTPVEKIKSDGWGVN